MACAKLQSAFLEPALASCPRFASHLAIAQCRAAIDRHRKFTMTELKLPGQLGEIWQPTRTRKVRD